MTRRVLALWAAVVGGAAAAAPAPWFESDLAEAVAREHLFVDAKTFVDATPQEDPASILAAYHQARSPGHPPLDLRTFVLRHFSLPAAPAPIAAPPGLPLDRHIDALWGLLQRPAFSARPGSTLLPLPCPYVVPGGRFRELYYWDSYFTILGLLADGHQQLARSMCADFADLERRYGFIPNGTRAYYLTRSQPPFFSLMVSAVAAGSYRHELEGEYVYWTDRSRWPTQHRAILPDGSTLSRYWDRGDTPRPEAWAADSAVAAEAPGRPAAEVWRDLRSAAESGWDFSSRWLGDGHSMATIITTRIAPVDLNCLLWHLETTLGLKAAAESRRTAILRHCWNAEDGCFEDYDLEQQRPTGRPTLATVFPLYFGLATPEQSVRVAATLRSRFLQPGGLVTTLAPTGQQWDWPNGWAPLQWLAITGLRRCGQQELAAEIARRWVHLNTAVYQRTGKLMEKYNVVDLALPGGGGEYPGQDGFGWTNGVLAALRGWIQ